MKRTNTNEFRRKVSDYLDPILQYKRVEYEAILDEGQNLYGWLVSTAQSEIGYAFDRQGLQGGMTEYLQGLGLSVDYLYCDIIRIAEDWHECTLTEKEQDMVCEKWFSFLATFILRFMDTEQTGVL